MDSDGSSSSSDIFIDYPAFETILDAVPSAVAGSGGVFTPPPPRPEDPVDEHLRRIAALESCCYSDVDAIKDEFMIMDVVEPPLRVLVEVPSVLTVPTRGGGAKRAADNDSTTSYSPPRQAPRSGHQCTASCDRVFATASARRDHERSCGAAGRGYLCAECGRVYTRKEHLTRHAPVHAAHATAHACPLCPAVFTRKDSVIRHVNRAHVVMATVLL